MAGGSRTSRSSATSPRVYLEVDSLQPVEAIRQPVVNWLDEVYRTTLAPLADLYGMVAEVGALAEPPDRWRRLRNERVWVEALTTLSTPEGKSLTLGAGEIEQGFTLRADLQTHYAASRLGIYLTGGLAGRAEWPTLQERLLGHFAAAAVATGASTGFIASNEEAGHTKYEYETNRYAKEGLEESDRWLRGVFWCTLLSQGHIEALGGIERVEREAPVAEVQRLRGLNGPLLLLQASDSLAGFDTAALVPVYEFLAPVLPPPAPLSEVPESRPRAPRSEPAVEIDPDIDADVAARLTFSGLLNEADRANLDQLLDAWYVLAVHGVFGGYVHNLDATAIDYDSETTVCTIGIDLGSGGIDALGPLVRLLVEAANEFSAPLLSISARNT